jgi:hypothetical protein
MSPRVGSTSRQTDWLTVSCNVTLTLTLTAVTVAITLTTRPQGIYFSSDRRPKAANLLLQWSPTSRALPAAPLSPAPTQLCSSQHRPVNTEELGRLPSRRPPKPANCGQSSPTSFEHKYDPFQGHQSHRVRVRRHLSDTRIRPFSGPSIQSCYNGCLEVHRHPTLYCLFPSQIHWLKSLPSWTAIIILGVNTAAT